MRTLLVALSLLSAATVAHATTYDAVSSFSTISNPTGVWSYGYGTPATFTLYNTVANAGGTTNWYSSALGTLPGIFYNPAGYVGSTNSFPGTELGLHPGPVSSGQDSILEFTAPTTGVYNLTSSFTRRDNTANGNGVDVGVYVDGALIVGSSDYLSNNSGHTPFVFDDASLSLAAGDVVLFDVNNNGEYSFDTTGVTAQLTTVGSTSVTPEPSSLVLLGSGIVSVFAAGRRRFFQK